MKYDIIVSTVEPEDEKKVKGLLWLDTTDDKNILKVYNGSSWLVLHF